MLRLLVDPVDPATLYLATPRAGFFRSSDGGAGWQAANVALGDRRILELAMNGSGTLYAATQSGLFQLLRGSSAWNPIDLGDGFRALPVTAVATRGMTVYAACAGRLLSSGDAGHTWSSAPANADTAAATRLAIAPDDDNTLFASDGTTLVKSSDGAGHFGALDDRPAGRAGARPLLRRREGALYAATALGALRLPSGGTDWSPLSTGPCTAIVASPTESDTLYLADESAGLLRLVAGQATTLAAPPHPEPTALAVAPTAPLGIYMGSHGGGPFRFFRAAAPGRRAAPASPPPTWSGSPPTRPARCWRRHAAACSAPSIMPPPGAALVAAPAPIRASTRHPARRRRRASRWRQGHGLEAPSTAAPPGPPPSASTAAPRSSSIPGDGAPLFGVLAPPLDPPPSSASIA